MVRPETCSGTVCAEDWPDDVHTLIPDQGQASLAASSERDAFLVQVYQRSTSLSFAPEPVQHAAGPRSCPVRKGA